MSSLQSMQWKQLQDARSKNCILCRTGKEKTHSLISGSALAPLIAGSWTVYVPSEAFTYLSFTFT